MIFTLVNRYTCPATKKVSIMAHEVNKDTLQVVKSYSRMAESDLPLFTDKADELLIIDVSKSSDLSSFGQLIKKEIEQ